MEGGTLTALLTELEGSIKSVARDAGPAVIGLGRGWGVGSGVVISHGRVLTNAHNTRGKEIAVSFLDGRVETARVIAADPDLDVAVIEVETGDVEPIGLPSEPVAAELGDVVLALANPGGRGLRATLGFVSATARSFRGPGGRRITGVIEHSAPLPRGSSGGPLLDKSGRLVGLNSMRLDGGLILAIPADERLHERVQTLARGEQVDRPRLGIAIATPAAARRLRRAVGLADRQGALVRAVEQGSPADRAGLERGDLIVQAGGLELDGVDALYEALDGAGTAGELELAVVRGTDERNVSVRFG
jgi:serine protease Do